MAEGVAAPFSKPRALLALLTRRRQVLAMLLSEQQRLRTDVAADTRHRIVVHVDWLREELKLLRGELQEAVRTDVDLARKHDVLRSVPGVGEQTALVLLADLPQLGELNRRQIAALVGLAPRAGETAEERRIWGGRARVRTALYMAAMVAGKSNSRNRALVGFYQRLQEAGKPKKVAQVASMRKLLVTLNAMVKRGEAWQDTR